MELSWEKNWWWRKDVTDCFPRIILLESVMTIRITLSMLCWTFVTGCVEIQRLPGVGIAPSLPTAAKTDTHVPVHSSLEGDSFNRPSGALSAPTRMERIDYRSRHASPDIASTDNAQRIQGDDPNTQVGSQSSWWTSEVTIGTWTTRPDTIVLILAVVALLVLIALSIQKAADGKVVFFSSYFDLFLSHLPLIVMVLISMASSASENENAGSPSSVYTGLFWSAIGYNYIKAFSDNSNTPFLAFCVGTGRITVGYLISIIILLNLTTLYSAKREGQSPQEFQAAKLSSLVSLGGCIWLISKLVGRNPRRVHYSDADEDSVEDDDFDVDGDGDGCAEDYDFDAEEDQYEYRQQQYTRPQPDSEPAKSFDPYEVLGIPQGATQDQIKQAYREMSRMYHPDKTAHLGHELQQVAHEKMKQINHAYQMLKRN
jgi:hypothetical protein